MALYGERITDSGRIEGYEEEPEEPPSEETMEDVFPGVSECIANWLFEFSFCAEHPDFSRPVARHPSEPAIAIWIEDEGVLIAEFWIDDDAEEALDLLFKLAKATGYSFAPSRKWFEELLCALCFVEDVRFIKEGEECKHERA